MQKYLNIKEFDFEHTSHKQLLLTLPIQIIGNHICIVSNQINHNQIKLMIRYSLDDYMIANNNNQLYLDDYNLPYKDRYNCDKEKNYREMNKKGKDIYQEYIELYQSQIYKDNYWHNNIKYHK